jgi:hypothetical protein
MSIVPVSTVAVSNNELIIFFSMKHLTIWAAHNRASLALDLLRTGT